MYIDESWMVIRFNKEFKMINLIMIFVLITIFIAIIKG